MELVALSRLRIKIESVLIELNGTRPTFISTLAAYTVNTLLESFYIKAEDVRVEINRDSRKSFVGVVKLSFKSDSIVKTSTQREYIITVMLTPNGRQMDERTLSYLGLPKDGTGRYPDMNAQLDVFATVDGQSYFSHTTFGNLPQSIDDMIQSL